VDAIERLKARIATIPNVLTSPPPAVEVLTLTLAGPVLAVRPYTAHPVPAQHYAARALPA
jgi:hypothetical protein